ncbi:response regulator [Fulvivirgaceae bacterium BMA12]|uniref:Response regulator n=1 Tax=Agaribacillus aureus TaxID=3051825 RepID=A0ABT8LFX3_9BACT|nr:response regulator [Fulvivirgaceae bacterium BMA12]
MNYMHKSIDLVMLVDKNPEANYINRRLIEISKFARQVITKTSGSKALEYLEINQKHRPLLPDIIFLDISTPPISAFEFLDHLDQHAVYLKNKCHVLVLSNSLKTYEIDNILRKRFVVGCMTKPLLVEKLNILKSSYFKVSNRTQRIN